MASWAGGKRDAKMRHRFPLESSVPETQRATIRYAGCSDQAAVRNKYQALRPVLDEKVRRRWAACEALAIGWGHHRGAEPLASLVPPFEQDSLKCEEALRCRSGPGCRAATAPSGGRGAATSDGECPGLLKALQALLEASTRGEPQSPLLWTTKHPASRRGPSRNKATK